MLPIISAPLEVGREECSALGDLISHLSINTGGIAIIKIFFFLILFLDYAVNRWLANLI